MDLLSQLSRESRENRVALDILARDVLQSRFLSALFASTMRHELILKGGLAMRAVHGSVRYTKDVDLQTGPEFSPSRIRGLVQHAIDEALASGLLVESQVTSPKSTPTTQRWKVNGTLAEGGSHVHMTIEISRRGLPDPSLVSSIAYAPSFDDGTKAVYLETYSPQALAATKVDALLAPNREAVRDVFDLFHLAIEMRVDPPTHLLKRLGKDAIAQALADLWPKIETMTWERCKDELLPSLPARAAAEIDEIEWDAMRMRTESAVRGWLEQAQHELELEAAGPSR